MSGFNIVARNIAGRNLTSWRAQASNDGSMFTDIVTANSTAFNAGVFKQIYLCSFSEVSILEIFILSSVGAIDVGIGMLQWTPTLTSRYSKKCHVGYVPRLTSNTNYRGFFPMLVLNLVPIT
jgi:hypothetical protein